MPPAAAQKLIDQLWHLTTDDSKYDIDYTAIDTSALQELRLWADAQFEQLTDEKSGNHTRLQTARDLLPVAKILAKIGQCPDDKIDGVQIELAKRIKTLSAQVEKLSGRFCDTFPNETTEFRKFKTYLIQLFVQPEPMQQTLDDMLQKPADEAISFFKQLEKIINDRSGLTELAQFLTPDIPRPKLKKNAAENYHWYGQSNYTGYFPLRYQEPLSVLSANLGQAQQQLASLTNSDTFIKHQAWVTLTTESGLIERKINDWAASNRNLWAPKATQTEALVKAQGDLLYAEYITGTNDYSDRDGIVAGTRNATAHKIVERELARMAEAAAQQQSTPPKLAPLRPCAVAITRPNTELHS